MTMNDRLEALTFRQLVAVLADCRNGSIGFDAFRDPRTNRKAALITFITTEHDSMTVLVALAKAEGGTPSAKPAPRAEAKQPTPAKPDTDNGMDAKLNKLSAMLLQVLGSSTDEAKVREIAAEVAAEALEPYESAHQRLAVDSAVQFKQLREAITGAKPTRVIVERRDTGTTRDMGIQHKQFPALLKLLGCRTLGGEPLNVWLTGPAGSGKTTAVRNAATALDLKFYFNGAIDNEYKLLGFTDAQGRVVSRPFRDVWTQGGVYLFDEVDASMPGALLAFNAALANGRCDFPDGCIERHADCVIVAAANTFGQGATADYVGRVKQDAAFLDRFVQFAWGYDETLEASLCDNPAWCKRVQKLRAKAATLGLRVIISPRATMFGAAMIAGGFTEDEAIAMSVRKGMTDEQWRQLA